MRLPPNSALSIQPKERQQLGSGVAEYVRANALQRVRGADGDEEE